MASPNTVCWQIRLLASVKAPDEAEIQPYRVMAEATVSRHYRRLTREDVMDNIVAVTACVVSGVAPTYMAAAETTGKVGHRRQLKVETRALGGSGSPRKIPGPKWCCW